MYSTCFRMHTDLRYTHTNRFTCTHIQTYFNCHKGESVHTMGKPQQATYYIEAPRGHKQTHQQEQHTHRAAQSCGGGWRDLWNKNTQYHRLHWMHAVTIKRKWQRSTTKCSFMTSLTSSLLSRWKHLHEEWYWFEIIILSNA